MTRLDLAALKDHVRKDAERQAARMDRLRTKARGFLRNNNKPSHSGAKEKARRARNIAKHGSPG